MGYNARVSDAADAIAYAYAEYRRTMVIECAGLFWIFAELVILFYVIAARRFVETAPMPASWKAARREHRRAVVWTALFALVSVVVLGRHWVRPPLYVQLASGLQPSEILPAYTSRAHNHLALWSVFVTLWVLLEAAIVYHGWRGCRHLRRVLGRPTSGGPGGLADAAMAAVLASALAMRGAAASADYASHPGPLMQALLDAEAADAVYRNALYFYLRVAGTVWVGVEWVAAVTLWRTYRLLAGVVRLRGSHP